MPATPGTPPTGLSPGPNGDANRIAVCIIALAFTAWLAWYYRFSPANSIAYVFHVAIAVPIIGLADTRWRHWVQVRFPASWRGGALIWFTLMVLIVATATPAQRGSATFLSLWAVYLAIPVAVFTIRSSGIRLVLATAAMVLPVGMLPMVRLAAPGRDTFSFGVLVLVDLGLMLLLLYRPDGRVVYSLWLSKWDAITATTAFLAYAAVALPLGLLLGFMRPGLGEPSIGAAVARLVELFFFVAVPEELVSRGLLQNGLERMLGRVGGLAAAAVIFGVAHIGHAPAPNWRYVLLATGAGAVYGTVFQRTRSITASAVTHALVDWTWFIFFAGLIPR